MATLTAAASLSPKPRVLGVTGGIAMGKSTITSLLQNVYRIPFHDADQCVRRLYAKGGPGVAPVAAAFGAGARQRRRNRPREIGRQAHASRGRGADQSLRAA